MNEIFEGTSFLKTKYSETPEVTFYYAVTNMLIYFMLCFLKEVQEEEESLRGVGIIISLLLTLLDIILEVFLL